MKSIDYIAKSSRNAERPTSEAQLPTLVYTKIDPDIIFMLIGKM